MNQVVATVKKTLLALLCTGLVSLTTYAYGAPMTSLESAPLSYQLHRVADKGMSAAQAAQIAKDRYGGKVLGVERQETSSGVVYKVRLLQDSGRVKTVTIRG